MAPDAARWSQVSALFDELVELDSFERRHRLDHLAIDEATRHWLLQLLSAHDSTDTHLLEQTLERIAADVIGAGSDAGRIPDRLDGQLIGRWRIGERIARGAMASVFHGERADGAYEQYVAIKLLHPGRFHARERDQLRQELRLLARLEHPGIARLIDGGVSDHGWPYLVMEYVDGQSIDRWCADQGLDLDQRLQLIIKVCDAVRDAHARLVVHADIKPSNVLVNRHGEPKLVDFGIAGLLRDDEESTARAAPFIRCSPAYAAPEQLRGEPISTACDVFGVGALMYELVTARRIRDGRAATDLLLGRSASEPTPAPSRVASGTVPSAALRGDLDAICLRALAEDPRQRYRTIDLLQQDLKNHLHYGPVTARLQTRPYLLSRWLRRHRLAAGMGALVVLILVVGLTVSIRQTQLARENARNAEAVTDFLLTVFEADRPSDFDSSLQTPRRDLAIRAAEELDRVLPEPTEARADLMLAIGRVLRKVGLSEQARPLLVRMIDELTAEGDRATDARAVAAWFELGQVESLDEQMDAAADAFRRAAALADTLLESPVAPAAIRFQLGRALRAAGQFDEALRVLENAMVLARSGQETGILVPRIRLLLALTLANADRFDEALRVGEQAVDEARSVFGGDHDRTAAALSTVGGMVRLTGNFESAEAMLREAYEIGVRNYGQPGAAAANNLAQLLRDRGELVEAEEFQTEALALAEARYGADSSAAARYRRNLGLIQALRQDGVAARDNLQRAVEIHARDRSPTDEYTLFLRAQWAWVLLDSGQSERAASVMRDLWSSVETLDGSHPRAALWIRLLAAELAAVAGDSRAAVTQVEAVDRLRTRRSINLDNWEQVRVPFVAGRVHAEAGDWSKAEPRWREARDLARVLLGSDHPLRVDIEQRLESVGRAGR